MEKWLETLFRETQVISYLYRKLRDDTFIFILSIGYGQFRIHFKRFTACMAEWVHRQCLVSWATLKLCFPIVYPIMRFTFLAPAVQALDCKCHTSTANRMSCNVLPPNVLKAIIFEHTIETKNQFVFNRSGWQNKRVVQYICRGGCQYEINNWTNSYV